MKKCDIELWKLNNATLNGAISTSPTSNSKRLIKHSVDSTHWAITYSKLTIKTLEQGVLYVQS